MSGFLQRLRLSIATGAALLAAVLTAPANAAGVDQGATFLTPFPDNDVYQVTVFGDGFANGLLGGFIKAFGSDVRLNIQLR